jgi:hypothetical protein
MLDKSSTSARDRVASVLQPLLQRQRSGNHPAQVFCKAQPSRIILIVHAAIFQVGKLVIFGDQNAY